MATARTTTTKPRGAKKPPAKPRVKTIAPQDVLLEGSDEGELLPLVVPEAEEPECRFPLEVVNGRCPVAVFNSPKSPNERIAYAKGHVNPLRFERGVLAVFEEKHADIVRKANPGGKTYFEADPKLAHDPLICKTCYPKTRWYSTRAFEQHMEFAHSGN